MKNSKPNHSDPHQTFALLSHHGHVLLYLVRHPEARLRDIAEKVGITERAAQKIVSDLEAIGMLSHERDKLDARRNRYQVHFRQPLQHPAEAEYDLRALLPMIGKTQITE